MSLIKSAAMPWSAARHPHRHHHHAARAAALISKSASTPANITKNSTKAIANATAKPAPTKANVTTPAKVATPAKAEPKTAPTKAAPKTAALIKVATPAQ